ncbi:MAG: hypothetical protein V4808_07695 [Pseudomonadota bacterium]
MDRRPSAVAATLIAIPALLLAGLSLVSARAAFMTLGADATLEEVRIGGKPGAERLTAAANANLSAAKWFESARYNTLAASALFAAASEGAKVAPGDVERPLRDALRISPASPYNWSRLAWLRYQAGDTKAAAAAWQMSVFTGRYKPPIAFTRLELGLKLRAMRDPLIEEEVRDQIILAARSDANGLARFANRTGAHALIRFVLARDNEASEKYETANKSIQNQIAIRARAAAK